MFKATVRTLLITLIFLLMLSQISLAQSTAFTYQGKLNDSSNPANGNYDLQFKLFDAASIGNQIGTTLTFDGNVGNQPFVVVANGIFTVQLDFGACPSCFNGAPRFLEMAVKVHGGGVFPAPLSPRQAITSTPYAVKSLNATMADGLSVACVNCVTSSQIASVNGSAVTGTIPVTGVPAGSSNYIQNTTSQQASSNFNISGNGTAGGTLSAAFVDASNHYRIAGLRAFTVNGPYNDGSSTTFTASNTFIGDGAGVNTTPSSSLNNLEGKFNAFFGAGAGQANITGVGNAFFGVRAGNANTSGSFNSFFGEEAGQKNTTGGNNAFFGIGAGINNTTGTVNSFFGREAGALNTGSGNAFFGYHTGFNTTNGSNNTFIGVLADFTSSSTSDNNTLLGAVSMVKFGMSNATAIGTHALVQQNNSLVLGGITGFNSGTDTSVGIGTTAPGALLDVQRDGNTIPETARFTTFGSANEILSRASGGTRLLPTATTNNQILLQLGATGHDGSDFVTSAKASILASATETWTPTAQGTRIRFNTTLSGTTTTSARMTINDDGNVGIGSNTPLAKLQVVTANDTNPPTVSAWDNRHFVIGGTASTGGIGFSYDQTNDIGYIEALSPSAAWRNLVLQVGGGNVGIGTSANAPNDRLEVNGIIRVATLGLAGSTTLCRNASNQISTCSSSLRYKTNLAPFSGSLSLINRLQPITFDWQQSGEHDLGLVAEEVAKIEPLLVTHNDKGEVEGVKYDRLGVVLINVVKEQQAQIDTQKKEISAQHQEIAALKKLVCLDHPEAEMCKP